MRPGQAAQAALAAERITAIGREFGYFTAQQITERTESTGTNASAKAGRWRSERRIVGITVKNQRRYPAFQFDPTGQPLPVIRDLIDAYEPATDYALFAWLTAPNGYLDGDRPVDLLARDPRAVLNAAANAQ